jgi:ribonuclease R
MKKRNLKKHSKVSHKELNCVTASLKMTSSGFGFARITEPDKCQCSAFLDENGTAVSEIFIPPKFNNGAIDGDIVMISPVSQPPDRKNEAPSARVVKIISRQRETFVGEIVTPTRVRALNSRMPREIYLTGTRRGAKKGDWVKLKFDGDSFDGDSFNARVVSIISNAGEVAGDLDAVMCEYEIAPRYSAEEEDAAIGIVPREIPRRDISEGAAVFTIDPADAKDFDDALSVEFNQNPKLCTVGIHIADVAAFITPGSRFDRAAAKRSFSAYLPGRTLPMLPAALTAAISLQQGKLSLAHSIFLTIDIESGEIVSYRREHTIIKVKHRINYDQLQHFFDTKEAPESWSSNDADSLLMLEAVAAKLRAVREKNEAFIELDLPEIHVVADEKKNIIRGLEKRIMRPAEALVEEFMLAANSAAGREMKDAALAGIYRVHDRITPEKSCEFSELMQQYFKIQCNDISDRFECIRFINSLPDDGKRNIILSMLLKSMPRAVYSVEADEEHFALGKRSYLHFTSPIRRYSDLINHQQLWNCDLGKRCRSRNSISAAADAVNLDEERIDNACNAANDKLKLHYLNAMIENGKCSNTVYEAVVTKVISAGIQVYVDEFGIFGFVPFNRRTSNAARKSGIRKYAGSSRMVLSYEDSWCNVKVGEYLYLGLARIDFDRNCAVFSRWSF